MIAGLIGINKSFFLSTEIGIAKTLYHLIYYKIEQIKFIYFN